jgi:MoxR-like ATPase
MTDTQPPAAAEVSAASAQSLAQTVADAVSSVIVGKAEQIRLLLVALLSEGHVLVDDVPGVAKTLLVRTMAAALGLSFARIQCTPDLLPSDVTGSAVFNQKTGEFEFRRGPIFANLVLADEINRATPRSQSSFLEAMEERRVTIDGMPNPLPRPFLVLATQNPVELRGTFPLPEAQLDRFLLRLRMGYPSAEEEVRILQRFRTADPFDDVLPVADAAQIAAAAAEARRVHVSPDLDAYIVDLVRATRESEPTALGASPRAALQLLHAAQASAAMDGRDYAVPDDVVALAPAVLAHRLILNRSAQADRLSPETVVEHVLDGLRVPVENPPDERP